MWDLPRPGLEPVSPALAGGFLTTVPPGKPYFLTYKLYFLIQRTNFYQEQWFSTLCKCQSTLKIIHIPCGTPQNTDIFNNTVKARENSKLGMNDRVAEFFSLVSVTCFLISFGTDLRKVYEKKNHNFLILFTF